MISRQWLNVVVAVTASAWIGGASAQSIGSGSAFDTVATYSTDDPKRLRMLAIVEHGLENQDLSLTIKQKAAVQDALDAFVSEMVAVNEKLSTARAQTSQSEVLAARMSVRNRLEAALTGIFTTSQRTIWEADKRARNDVIARMKPTGRPFAGTAATR